MVDELAAVGCVHAFLDGADLAFVEIHELPDRLRGQGCAAAVSGLGEPVEALAGRGVEPEDYGFTHLPPPVHNAYIVCSGTSRVNPTPVTRGSQVVNGPA